MQRRKLRVGIGAGVALVALLVSGCSAGGTSDGGDGDGGAAAEGPEGLNNPGVLTACMTPGYPPMEFFENGIDGKIIGIDADGIRALADLWGVEAKIEEQAFEGLIPALQAGRCDILWSGLYMSEERLEVLDGVAYMTTGPALGVRAGEEGGFKDELDLCGESFGTQSGGIITGIVKDLSDRCVAEGEEAITVEEYPMPNDIIASVLNGKLTGIVETDIGLQLMVEETSGLAFVDGIFPADTEFGVFTPKGSELSAHVADGVRELIDNGTMTEILDRYNIPATRVAATN